MQIITDENTKIENNLVLPVLAVRGLVFFPGMMLQFETRFTGRCRIMIQLR